MAGSIEANVDGTIRPLFCLLLGVKQSAAHMVRGLGYKAPFDFALFGIILIKAKAAIGE